MTLEQGSLPQFPSVQHLPVPLPLTPPQGLQKPIYFHFASDFSLNC